jgi:hypothetical protein
MTKPLIKKKSSTPRYPYLAIEAKGVSESEVTVPLEIPLKK